MTWRPCTCWKGLAPALLEGVGVDVDDRGLVRVPYRTRNGRLVREHYLAPNGRAWWGPGEGLLPFLLDWLPPAEEAHGRALIVAEGESDTLALVELFAGADVDVLGLPGASTWRAGWRVFVEPFSLVYAIGDGDEAGRRMGEAILRDVTWARLVRLPDGEDARSILQRGGWAELEPFFAAADRRVRLAYGFRQASTIDELEQLLRAEAA